MYVDADACPVKKEISCIAGEMGWKVIFIASYDHKPNDMPDQENWIFVDPGNDAADLYITNKIKKNDVLVTQDIGLAGIVLNLGVRVLSPRGKIFTNENIETALGFRFLAAKERRQGKYSKGPSPYSQEDREYFSLTFRRILSNFEGD